MDSEILYNFIDIEIPDFNPEFFDLWILDVVTDNQFELNELSYVFCSDEYLLEMNKTHLDHDYYTDIITFNYNEGISLSGDLFISYDRVLDNAKELKVSVYDELCRVMVHGVLHLVGFDDKSEEDEKLMRIKEDYYLNKRERFT
jgi:rRNA maturation RNase YbeY